MKEMPRPTGSPQTDRLLRFLQYGLLVLVAVMPFHAFLSVFLGSAFGGQLLWQAWKELLVAALLVIAFIIVLREPGRLRRLLNPLNGLIAVFAIVALIVTAATPPPLVPLLAGLRYDLEPFVLLILAQLAAAPWMLGRIQRLIIGTGIVVGAVAALQALVLPRDFMTRFGYGPETVVPYQLVDPAIEAIRVPSTLGGPNQMGAYLILVLALGIILLWQRRWLLGTPAAILSITGIIVSHSRSAWIGAMGAALALVASGLSRARALLLLAVAVLGAAVGLAGLSAVGTDSNLQYYVFHSRADGAATKGSTGERIAAMAKSIEAIRDQPLGYGLGSAGPASFRNDRPFISESQYLQIALETGLPGLALYAAVYAVLAVMLFRKRRHPLARGLLAALAGVSLVNLFLHGWTDSTLAFVWSIAAGVVIGLPHDAMEDTA